MELHRSNKQNHTRLNEIQETFSSALPEEVNIYNQAHLIINTPLVPQNNIHKKTPYEIGISFKLSGDISGSAICFLDTYKQDIATKDLSFLSSLYKESMNIILGKIMTKIDFNSNKNIIISSPEFITSTEELNDIDGIILGCQYKLLSNLKELNTRINFIINK